MATSRQALRLAQTPAPERVYAEDGTYAGIVDESGRWSCGSCMAEGGDGWPGLLAHDRTHQNGDAA